MTKISIEDLKMTLDLVKIAPEQRQDILNRLEEIIKENEEHKNDTKLPSQKNQFGVILYSEDPSILNNQELTASVFTIPEGDDMGLVLGKISAATKEQNGQVKKKNNIIETIGGAFQNLKRKYIKQHGVNLKTKIPVRVLVSNNKLA